jgi:hypothetical protein
MLEPMRPSPITPMVLPSRFSPTETCQWPLRIDAHSAGMSRTAAMIKAQVSSAAPLAEYPVAQTVMPRSVAATKSMEALRAAVEAISFRFGSCSRMARFRGVRSRITQTTSNG